MSSTDRGKVLWAKRKAEGVCPRCGSSGDLDGCVTCQACRAENQQRKAELRAAGLCVNCSTRQTHLGYKHCLVCLERKRKKFNISITAPLDPGEAMRKKAPDSPEQRLALSVILDAVTSLRVRTRPLAERVQDGAFLFERTDQITRFWFTLAGCDLKAYRDWVSRHDPALLRRYTDLKHAILARGGTHGLRLAVHRRISARRPRSDSGGEDLVVDRAGPAVV